VALVTVGKDLHADLEDLQWGLNSYMLLPAGMAIISAAYSGDERAAALGTLVGVAGVAQSIGPLAGGFLTAEISWRFVFLVNLPRIAVIMIVTLRRIRESHDETASRRLDVAGVILMAHRPNEFFNRA